MNVELRVFEIDENSSCWKSCVAFDDTNAFVIVGEEDGLACVHQLDTEYNLKIMLKKIDKATCLTPFDSLTQTNTFVQYDLNRNQISKKALEAIQKYNRIGGL